MSKVFNSFLSTVDDFWNFILIPFRWIKNVPGRLRELAPFATLVSFILAYYSFQVATKARKEGAEITKQTVAMIDTMKAATKQISENLKSIPEASKSFKIGIDKMTSSIDTLKTNLNAFSSSLQNYDGVLKTVAEVTKKNLDLVQKQQQIWEQELGKEPKLELQLRRAYIDSLGKVRIQAQIANLGNAAVKEFYIIVNCPKLYKVQTKMSPWDTTATIQSYSHTFNQLFGPAKSEKDFHLLKNEFLDFSVDKIPSKMTPYIFQYTITHEKNRNGGLFTVKAENIEGFK